MNSNLIIIPTYNEKDNIELMVPAVFEENSNCDLLIVDDMSPDGTGEKVKTLQSKHSNLYLIERQGPRGLGHAYLVGFAWALERNYQRIIEMDCDFSHNPKDVQSLIKATQDDFDLAIGSRYYQGIRIINWPFFRLLLSYFASIYIRIVTCIPVLDATGGFKCFKREVLESIDLNQVKSNGYVFQLELNYRAWKKGYKVGEIPIIFTERRDGQSKMSRKIIFEAFWRVIWLRLLDLCGRL